MHFAAHDDGFIYGVGPTPEEALAEFRASVGDEDMFAYLGPISVSEITADLAAQVEAEGGNVAWERMPDGMLCTLVEAFA